MMRALITDIHLLKVLFLSILLFFSVNVSFAQPALPQRTLTVTATQAISFGSFCVTGNGGSVTVGHDGTRSVSNSNIIPLIMAPTAHQAIFEIKLCQGRNVIINLGGPTPLTAGNGVELWLQIDTTDKGNTGSSFMTNRDCNFVTLLNVGGTLTIPGNAPPGTYTGYFDIIFNQQ